KKSMDLLIASIEECYKKLGGSYADVSLRLPNLKLIDRFFGKFLEDKSFETLCLQMNSGNRPEAFRAAHTLKGVCANLGFTGLLESVSRLTEELRRDTEYVSEQALTLFEEVCRDYETTADAVRKYLGL
ncbi:MAG: Hpt domain-containing protein, partial [Acutalibacteraceae bacterium]